jgi:LysR family transcriptional activator of nhaA
MNFKHLHYFWVTAKAAASCGRASSCTPRPKPCPARSNCWKTGWAASCFARSGRKLELTEDGHLALGYADQIFTLGAELESAVRQAHGGQRVLDFKVGVADSVTKSIAYRLLEPALSIAEPVRLVCSEGKFPDLLAQLALNRLDLVICSTCPTTPPASCMWSSTPPLPNTGRPRPVRT